MPTNVGPTSKAVDTPNLTVKCSSDQDVAECPNFNEIAIEVESSLIDSWVVGHNVRFDAGFMHRYEPLWPSDTKGNLRKPLYDALTNGRRLPIRYINAEGQSSSRMIRPETSFATGRFTYIRAFCEKSSEVRTFRLDRIVIDDEDTPPTQE